MTTIAKTATAIKTSIVVTWTTAPLVRMTARVDLEEYGLKAGDMFYLAHSESESAAQGQPVYHIVRWGYTEMRWLCPCEDPHKVCCHTKKANADARKRHQAQVAAAKAAKEEQKAEQRAATLAAQVQATELLLARIDADTAAHIARELAQAATGTRVQSEQRRAMDLAPTGTRKEPVLAPLNGNRAFSLPSRER